MCQTHPCLCWVMNQATPQLTFPGNLDWWERNCNTRHWTAMKPVLVMLENHMGTTGGLLEIRDHPLAHTVITAGNKLVLPINGQVHGLYWKMQLSFSCKFKAQEPINQVSFTEPALWSFPGKCKDRTLYENKKTHTHTTHKDWYEFFTLHSRNKTFYYSCSGEMKTLSSQAWKADHTRRSEHVIQPVIQTRVMTSHNI